MNLLKNYWKKRFKPRPSLRFWAAWFAIISAIGFLDASYLTVKHYLGETVGCSFLKGCETVTTSSYATISGIPVALGGAIYYLIIFLLTIFYLDTGRKHIFGWAAQLTGVGLLASTYFLFLQIFIIKALCLYCLISAATSILLFAFSQPVKTLISD